MPDVLRLLGQILAAAFMAAFFLLAALVIFGTIAACVRTRQPSPRAPRRLADRPHPRPLPEDRFGPART
jgi:hypothetical protein